MRGSAGRRRTAALRFGDLAVALRLGMEAARCGAPNIYGREHIGEHGKREEAWWSRSRRRLDEVRHGHVRKTTAPDTWGTSISETRGREAGDATTGLGGALGQGRGNRPRREGED